MLTADTFKTTRLYEIVSSFKQFENVFKKPFMIVDGSFQFHSVSDSAFSFFDPAVSLFC